MKLIKKYTFLLLIGGLTYNLIELIYRQRSHWTMFLLGGICFILIGLLNEVIPWKMPLYQQALIGSGIITSMELIAGYIINIKLNWNIWDYSNLPFNYKGQICLWFFFIWIPISVVSIVLDDWVRYYFFNEDKPHYKLF